MIKKILLVCLSAIMATTVMAEKWPTNITPGMLNAGKGNGTLSQDLRVIGYSDFDAGYDASGRLIGIAKNGEQAAIQEDGSISLGGYTCVPSFNANGYISSLTLTKNATRHWDATFEYNANDQLTVCDYTDFNDEDQTIWHITLTYDADGKLLTIKKEKTEVDDGKIEVKPSYLYELVYNSNTPNPYGQYQDDICDILFSEKFIEFFYPLGLFGRGSTVFADNAMETYKDSTNPYRFEFSTELNDMGLLTKHYIYGMVNTSIDAVHNDSKEQYDIFSLDGVRQSGLEPGINIIRHKDGSAKKVIIEK